jgi:hypothetical protein
VLATHSGIAKDDGKLPSPRQLKPNTFAKLLTLTGKIVPFHREQPQVASARHMYWFR